MIRRKDRDDTRECYCQAILTLFVPWRSIQDLCDLSQTWKQAFEPCHVKITAESNKIIDNIQLLHECKNDRDEHLQQVIQHIVAELIVTVMLTTVKFLMFWKVLMCLKFHC